MSAAEAGQSQKKKVGISVSAVLLISFSANAFFFIEMHNNIIYLYT